MSDIRKEFVDVVFDTPPGPYSGRFVDVENSVGESINFYEWVQRRADGYWAIRIALRAPSAAATPIAQAAAPVAATVDANDEPQAAPSVDSDAAKRLRGLCSDLGVPACSVPQGDAELLACLFSLLGSIRFRVRELKAAPSGLSDALVTALLDANDMCRSAYQVAQRIATEHGTTALGTRFGALQERLHESLSRQHEVLRPYHAAIDAAQQANGGAK